GSPGGPGARRPGNRHRGGGTAAQVVVDGNEGRYVGTEEPHDLEIGLVAAVLARRELHDGALDDGVRRQGGPGEAETHDLRPETGVGIRHVYDDPVLLRVVGAGGDDEALVPRARVAATAARIGIVVDRHDFRRG